MEPTSLAERIVELEVLVAHQQRAYDSLNEVVTEQAARLDRMQRRLLRLEAERRPDPGEPPGGEPLEEKPPHY